MSIVCSRPPNKPACSLTKLANLVFSSNTINIVCSRPTNKPADQQKNGKMEVGIADDQAKDFDFEKTEMKYDSTGMFHWTPARSIEDCILVCLF